MPAAGHVSPRVRMMVAEYVAGASLREVAEKFGVSKPAVSLALKRQGGRLSPDAIEARKRAWHAARIGR